MTLRELLIRRITDFCMFDAETKLRAAQINAQLPLEGDAQGGAAALGAAAWLLGAELPKASDEALLARWEGILTAAALSGATLAPL